MPISYKNGKIYKIFNSVNDMIYIGSTCQPLSKRMAQHRSTSKKFTGTLYEFNLAMAMGKYGIDKFFIVLVEEWPCDSCAQLEMKEYKVIASFPYEKLYNEKKRGPSNYMY